jgi:hypothetical protein
MPSEEADDCCVRSGIQTEARRVHRDNGDVVVMRAIARRRAGPGVAERPPSFSPLTDPGGRIAPVGSDVVPAGMSQATQCQNPLPVGASESNIVTTKLCVPAGAPCQDSSGETPALVHPQNCGGIGLPAFRSVLVTVIRGNPFGRPLRTW